MQNNLRKIKLLFITYTHSGGGGAEKILTTLVNAIDADKYDITIQEVYNFDIKTEPVNKNIKMLPPIIKEKGDSEFNKRFKRYCIENYPELFRSIYNLGNYDIIITWNYQCPSCVLPAFSDKKTISWFHGSIEDLNTENNFKFTKYEYNIQKKSWAYADKIVTISDKSLQSFIDIFPEYKNKIQIIYNPINYAEIEEKAKEKISLPVSNNLFVLICIGRLDKNKNFQLPIKAAKLLKKSNFPFVLFIIGTGKLFKALQRQVKDLQIEDNVLFLGHKENPFPYIKNGDLLCMSSYSEGFPTVICEAMVLGKPFITTPVAGASKELSDNNKCGLVSDWDAQEYANKIKIILSDKRLYKEMSDNCIKKIKEFSVESAVSKFYDLINSLPQKNEDEYTSMDKLFALKRLKKIYVWNIDYATQRLQFSFDKFIKNKHLMDFIKTGFHFFCFICYIILTPVRLMKNIKEITNHE